MYAGYTESAEKIEARKRRILADYKPQPKPSQDKSAGSAQAIKRQQAV